ncbi:MAG: CHASE2 domain-containing protein [Leptolyngbya sp. BL-A-14]
MNTGRQAGRQRRKSFRQNQFQDWALIVIAASAAISVLLLSWLGLLQTLDWVAIDYFFRWRPAESVDSRIVVVTIDDNDITNMGKWPIPDEILAKVLVNLDTQKPRAIGLDIYRDFPVEPGHQKLVNIFRSKPNLIGVQRWFGTQKVLPPPALAELNQIADADIPEDSDKRVRRAMLTGKEGGQVYMGLGLAIALKYLEAEKISPIPSQDAPDTYQLGRARFTPLRGSDGGYVRADDRGYQVLLNFRGPASSFQTISFSDVLHNQLPDNFVRNKVVFIGSTAESVKDLFLTPYSTDGIGPAEWTPGIFIHANITSQILSAALDGRSLLHGLPNSLQWAWIAIWSSVGVLISRTILQANWLKKQFAYGVALLGTFLATVGLVTVSYLLFLASWWFPVASPILALNSAVFMCFAYHSYKLQRLAYFDELTQVANRRYFDLYLAEQSQKKGNLSLILCDIDCFKLYNDTYGHQAGDECLRRVATTIRSATRQTDFVARYGGEEFVVVLPHASLNGAAIVASSIIKQVKALEIPHQTSVATPFVTLSCGVTAVKISDQHLRNADWSGSALIAQADTALYTSKCSGRDRFTVMALD